jgi:hypothetical protein
VLPIDVRFERVDGQLKPQLVCQHVEIQFGLPINVMVVDYANRVARVLLRMNVNGSSQYFEGQFRPSVIAP